MIISGGIICIIAVAALILIVSFTKSPLRNTATSQIDNFGSMAAVATDAAYSAVSGEVNWDGKDGGLYTESGQLVKSWDELINEGYLSITNDMYGTGVSGGSKKAEMEGALTIDSSITSISDLEKCSNLSSVKIPNSVKRIGNYAFYYCVNLESIEIPNSVVFLGQDAFGYCKSLTNITIPNSMTEINQRTFQGCEKLESIEIPENVTYIGPRAFYEYKNLTNIRIPEGVTEISSMLVAYCRKLTHINIPENIVSIGACVFRGSGISSITYQNHDYNSISAIKATLLDNNVTITGMGNNEIDPFYGAKVEN